MRLLLGAKAASLTDIRLPCLASYKYDGWRGLWQGLEFFTRNGKTIPNRALQRAARQYDLPPGWDGEVIVGAPSGPGVFDRTNTFCKTLSASIPPEGVRFLVFDNSTNEGDFLGRQASIFSIPPFVEVVEQEFISTYDDLEAFEARAVELGYEGICTRAPHGPYKHGRSTLKEQYLVKLKRYIDGEFQIIGAEELMHNANPAFISETGYTKRSTHQDGKIPAGVLGKIIVDWCGHELRVGTGFDSEDRAHLWQRFLRGDLVGDWATIRYSPPTKTLPRQPVFKAIRGDVDQPNRGRNSPITPPQLTKEKP